MFWFHLCNNGDLIWDGSEWRHKRVDIFKVYFTGKTDPLENIDGKKRIFSDILQVLNVSNRE